MAKLTIESVKKSFKETITGLYTQYLERILTGGAVDEDLIDRIGEHGGKYLTDIENCVIDLGGNPDDVREKWFIEAMNDIKLGDILKEYIF